MTNGYTPVKFLIVDDDIVSVMSMKRAIKELKLANPERVAKDGLEALEILRDEAGPDQSTPPYIVTLDINMPRMNGHEFLEEMRQDPSLRRVVVFVFSTSDAPEDINAAYDQNVAGYLVKDNTADSLRNAIQMIEDYSHLVVFPS